MHRQVTTGRSTSSKLRRICQSEVRRLKASHTPATVKFYLSKYRDSIRQIDPNHLVLRPRKMRSGQRFSYLALEPEETRVINAAYHQRVHRDQSNLIPLDRKPSSKKLSNSWPAIAISKKAWAPWL